MAEEAAVDVEGLQGRMNAARLRQRLDALHSEAQSLTQGPTGPVPEISDKGEGSFLMRASASVKMNDQDKFSYLEAVLGKGNVFVDKEKGFFIRDRADPSKIVPFDSENINLKDFTADIFGPALEAAPAVALSGSGVGGVLKAAGGAGVGNIARQTLSAALPGEESMTTGERVGEVVTAAAIGGVSQAAVNTVAFVGGRVADLVRRRPFKFLAPKVQDAMGTPFAQEGVALEQKVGPLSLGEVTGQRSIKQAEGVARRSISASDQFFKFEQTQLNAALGHLDNTMGRIGQKKGQIEVGDAIKGAFDQAVDAAETLRAKQAEVDFGTLRSVSQGQPVIPTRNLVAQIDNFITEMSVPGAGDATQALVGKIGKIKETLAEAGALTGEQAKRLLEVYTKMQKGTGILLTDIDKAQSRFMAGRLKDALLTDLDDAVAAGGPGSSVTMALKTARDNYRTNSEAVNELARSVLAKIVGDGNVAPERVAERITTKLVPSEIKATMGIIEQASPVAANAVRRRLIEVAIEKSAPAATTQAASGLKFSAAKFLQNVPDDETLTAAGFAPQAIAEIKTVAKFLERVADKEFTGSPTAPIAMAWDVLRGAFTLNPLTMGKLGGQVLLPKAIADATLTKEGRQALMTLSTQAGPTRKVVSAAVLLMGISAKDFAAEEFHPFTPPPEAQLP